MISLLIPSRRSSVAFYDPVHAGSRAAGTDTARRAELDELEAQLAKRLAEVRTERDELAVAERVLERMTGQIAEERASTGSAPGQVGRCPRAPSATSPICCGGI
ncbi:hypothetical protein ACWC9Q_35090 [Streptomyces sp. NPDC001142]